MDNFDLLKYLTENRLKEFARPVERPSHHYTHQEERDRRIKDAISVELMDLSISEDVIEDYTERIFREIKAIIG